MILAFSCIRTQYDRQVTILQLSWNFITSRCFVISSCIYCNKVDRMDELGEIQTFSCWSQQKDIGSLINFLSWRRHNTFLGNCSVLFVAFNLLTLKIHGSIWSCAHVISSFGVIILFFKSVLNLLKGKLNHQKGFEYLLRSATNSKDGGGSNTCLYFSKRMIDATLRSW